MAVGAGVGVAVCVWVGVPLGVAVAVFVGVGVAVGAGVGVGLATQLGAESGFNVNPIVHGGQLPVPLCGAVGAGEGDAVEVAVGTGVSVGVGLGVDVGAAAGAAQEGGTLRPRLYANCPGGQAPTPEYALRNWSSAMVLLPA